MLSIDVEKNGEVAVVRCSGRLVRGAEVTTLRDAVISEKNTRVIVLDLSEVQMLDAGGLNALVSLHLWSRSRAVQLKLVNPNPFVKQVLTSVGMDRVFEISSFHEALLVIAGRDCREMRYAMAS
jgi:anti-anti-sigma factor